MSAKHTPGPWSVFDDNGSQRLIVNEATTIAKTMCGNDKANARLIAASPVGLEAAELAYAALIAHQRDAWRLQNQHVYCALRDFIAKARGLSEEEVQDAAESAAIAEATGETP